MRRVHVCALTEVLGQPDRPTISRAIKLYSF